MIPIEILVPIIGAGFGMAAAYGATHKPLSKRIHFVSRDNLKSELEDLEINIESGETCVECDDEIGTDEIGAVVREKGEYKIVCNNPKCLDTYDVD